MNPYNWQEHRPKVEVPRDVAAPVAASLQRGGSAVVLAGRGMGKSVFLRQVAAAAERLPDVRVERFPRPPPEFSYRACLEAAARRLGLAADGFLDSGELIAAYVRQDDAPRHLILLYDEFDRYARIGDAVTTDQPGRDFFNDLEVTRREFGVGILAAGSIGVFVFRDVLGSTFLSRAEQVLLPPFARQDLDVLAEPFADRGETLAEETLELLLLATGGNPALVTYGLEKLWPTEPSASDSIAEIFANFQRQHRQYLLDIQRSFAEARLSGAPQRVWELVRQSAGSVAHSQLQEACGPSDDPLSLDFIDVLDLLQAAGLVRVIGSVNADPVALQPITSIISLMGRPSTAPRFRDRFLQDIEALLGQLHALSADFFRPGSAPGGKQLVPESTFAAVLSLGFHNVGWRVEREAQYGAGRTDLKLGRYDAENLAVIELKIWGRNDYKEAQRQIEGYWSNNVAAGAVVMLTDADLPDWPDRYRRECLEPWGVAVEPRVITGSPIRACFTCRSVTADGMNAEVDHYLLRIGRR